MNLIYHKITFRNEKDFNLIKDYMVSEDNDFDFNKLKPIPKELSNFENPDLAYQGLDFLYLKSVSPFRKLSEEESKRLKEYFSKIDLFEKNGAKNGTNYKEVNPSTHQLDGLDTISGKQLISNMAEYGFNDLKDARKSLWGTPFNSIDAYWGEDCSVTFTTGNGFCLELLCILANNFPDVKWKYIYSDEFKENIGTGKAEKGLFEFRTLETSSKESERIPKDLLGAAS